MSNQGDPTCPGAGQGEGKHRQVASFPHLLVWRRGNMCVLRV